MTPEPTRSEGEPHSRLTRLADVMTQALEAHPEHRDGDRAIVLLDDDVRGGIVLHGYDDDDDAIAAMLSHLRAILRVHGRDLQVHKLGGDG